MLSESITAWLASTALAQTMINVPWMWPLCETLHFVGLALLIGTAGIFDLRLLGFMRGMPVAAAMQMRVWAGIGVVINLITGVLFFIAAPAQYMNNIAFWWKMGFLAVAIINIAWFELRYGKELAELPANADTPSNYKLAGSLSLFSWMAVLYFGRMLPFIGDAF